MRKPGVDIQCNKHSITISNNIQALQVKKIKADDVM